MRHQQQTYILVTRITPGGTEKIASTTGILKMQECNIISFIIKMFVVEVCTCGNYEISRDERFTKWN